MKNDYRTNRHIRVFISSTFKRMEGEREMLISKTFPVLRRIAQERDVMLTEVDLRWGITPEESQNGKVVEICLKEIENSIPFFIGIIGDRYGWVPNECDIPESTLGRFGKVNEYLKRELSVTEMEMQFGVLERSENMNAFFFIKDGDGKDPEEPESYHDKLSELKNAVFNNTRYPVSGYSSSEDLSEQVEKCFISLIDSLFPEKTCKEEREDTLQDSVVNRLCFCYVPSEDGLEKIDSFVGDSSHNVLLVEGESGSGKSSLLANWANIKKNDRKVFYHNLAASGQSEPGIAMVRRCSRLLADAYGLKKEIKQNYEDATSDLSGIISELDRRNESPVIILDGLERISSAHLAQCLSWIPTRMVNVKIICSAISGSQACNFLKGRDYTSFIMPALTYGQRESLVTEYLQEYHSKHLTPSQIASVANSPVAGKPAILCTMLNELANYGIHEKLDSFIDEQLVAENEEAFYEHYLVRLENIFGDQFVSSVFGTISLTKNGIPEPILIEFTDCSRMLLSQFLGYINDTASNDNGLLDISNAVLEKMVERRYFSGAESLDSFCNRFISFLGGRNDSWSVIELAYQLHRQGRRKELAELVMVPENLDLLYKNDYDSLFFMICEMVQKDGFSLSPYHGILDACTDSPVYSDVVGELFSLSILISESGTITSFSERLDKAIAETSPSRTREESMKKRTEYCNIAEIYYGMNWYFERIVDFAEKAIACCDGSVPFEKEDCINLLALGQSKTFKLKEAKKNIEKIIDSANAFDVTEQERDSHLGKYYHTFGLLYRASSNENRLEKYYEYQQTSLEHFLKAHGEDSAQMILPYLETAEAAAFEHAGEAMAYYEKARNICKYYYGTESPQMEECISRLILICYYSKDYERMSAELENAIPLFMRMPKNLHTSNSLDIINKILWSTSDDKLRVSLCRAEVELSRQFYGPNSSLAHSLHDLGDAYRHTKSYSEAEKCYLEALGILLRKYNGSKKKCLSHPVMWCYDGLWSCNYNTDQYEKSYQYASQAVAYAHDHELIDEEHWTEKELGLSAWKTGRKQEASENLMLFYKSKHKEETKKTYAYKVILPAMEELGLIK